MKFLNQLAEDRRKFLEGLEANKDDINLEIFQDFYPDKTHLIYELLQNAEDAEASEVSFLLSENSLSFEHNGRAFSKEDVKKITGIGTSTKDEDIDKIGQFGIGFKAVFVYTETPRIWSPTFAFEISHWVVPSELSANLELDDRTRFEFPFNSRRTPKCQAYAELQDGLKEISDNTLLFLSRIREIQWQIDGTWEGRLIRIQHSEYHIEIRREVGEEVTKSAHFLCFTESVEGLERQYVSIAYELQPQASDSAVDDCSGFAERFRIVKANRGRVAVYFTAIKETSNLRFHLHAPFVPELSRSSIKDTPANEPLLWQLAALAARSLSIIRDLGLLDREFLAVLPNSNDAIPAQYVPIRQAIIDTMNEQPLTPVHNQVGGSHAPARRLLQGQGGLKALLSRDDICFLVDDANLIGWAMSATQRNSEVDRFLRDLDIKQWGVEQFANMLEVRFSNRSWDWTLNRWRVQSAELPFLAWIRQKPMEWHCALYALFYRVLEGNLTRLKHVRIVRLSDGGYKRGIECFFPTPETRDDPIHPRVAEATYNGGRSKAEQADAKAFLEGVGVRDVGELQQIEAILKRRYADPGYVPSWDTYEADLKRFIELLESDRNQSLLFSDYYIFQGADNRWSKPNGIYLDTPYIDSGLHAYYDRVESKIGRAPLSDNYHALDILARFVGFCRTCGVVERLAIWQVSCDDNPQRQYLESAPGSWLTETGKNRDFVIPNIAEMLEEPSLPLSRLVWNTLCDQSHNMAILEACFQYNQSNEPYYADSQLVHQLRDSSWVPQRGDTLSFIRPDQASRDLLPEGFPCDPSWPWLQAICFGAKTESSADQLSRTQELAREIGVDEEALEVAKWFGKLPTDEKQRILARVARGASTDLPKHEPANRERRSELVWQEAQDAPRRMTEGRQRSVSVGLDSIKREMADPYLRALYTNFNGVTICQVCQDSLPFKTTDGSYFFETVEFIKELDRRHFQNYLALCPNHAAMYMHANPSIDEMKDKFLATVGPKMDLTLAGQSVTIYFTDTHMVDLRAIIDDDGTE